MRQSSLLLVCLLQLTSAGVPAAAQEERPKVRSVALAAPLPPVRPPNLSPPPSRPDAGDVTSTIAAVPAPSVAAARRAPVPEPPHDLPVATRARMHECGAQWQQMKMSGAAADKTWRTFAQTCLVSQAQ